MDSLDTGGFIEAMEDLDQCRKFEKAFASRIKLSEERCKEMTTKTMDMETQFLDDVIEFNDQVRLESVRREIAIDEFIHSTADKTVLDTKVHILKEELKLYEHYLSRLKIVVQPLEKRFGNYMIQSAAKMGLSDPGEIVDKFTTLSLVTQETLIEDELLQDKLTALKKNLSAMFRRRELDNLVKMNSIETLRQKHARAESVVKKLDTEIQDGIAKSCAFTVQLFRMNCLIDYLYKAVRRNRSMDSEPETDDPEKQLEIVATTIARLDQTIVHILSVAAKEGAGKHNWLEHADDSRRSKTARKSRASVGPEDGQRKSRRSTIVGDSSLDLYGRRQSIASQLQTELKQFEMDMCGLKDALVNLWDKKTVIPPIGHCSKSYMKGKGPCKEFRSSRVEGSSSVTPSLGDSKHHFSRGSKHFRGDHFSRGSKQFRGDGFSRGSKQFRGDDKIHSRDRNDKNDSYKKSVDFNNSTVGEINSSYEAPVTAQFEVSTEQRKLSSYEAPFTAQFETSTEQRKSSSYEPSVTAQFEASKEQRKSSSYETPVTAQFEAFKEQKQQKPNDRSKLPHPNVKFASCGLQKKEWGTKSDLALITRPSINEMEGTDLGHSKNCITLCSSTNPPNIRPILSRKVLKRNDQHSTTKTFVMKMRRSVTEKSKNVAGFKKQRINQHTKAANQQSTLPVALQGDIKMSKFNGRNRSVK